MSAKNTYPYKGEFHPSPQRKFSEVIVLVHFYGGHKKALKKHLEWLLEEGYDCFVFDLYDNPRNFRKSFLNSKLEFGMKKVWADQIEHVLSLLPGKKIIYSFSNPSASAFEVIARRQAADIAGQVADGGPSGDLWKSMINYFTHEYPLPTFPVKLIAAVGAAFVWHPRFLKVMHEDLAKIPVGFKILSVRGWKDPLISPAMLDKVFDPHTHLDWRKLSLPEGGHLDGLKNFPEDYKPAVLRFLKEISSPLTKS